MACGAGPVIQLAKFEDYNLAIAKDTVESSA
jgi:hypothetical protein